MQGNIAGATPCNGHAYKWLVSVAVDFIGFSATTECPRKLATVAHILISNSKNLYLNKRN